MSRLRTSGWRTGGRVAGLVLAVSAAGWGGLSLASQMAHQRTSAAVTLPPEVTRFDTQGIPGRLTLTGVDAASVRLIQHVTTGLTSPDITRAILGDTVRYGADCAWWDERCSVDLDVSLNASQPVTADSSGGDIVAAGLRGGLVLTSSGGNIRVNDVGGIVQLESSAGDVQATHLSATRVVATSSAGDVRLEFVSPPDEVVVNSSAGDVLVVLPRGDAYRVETDASAGDERIEVDTSEGSARVIRATSSAGDVTVRYAP